MNEGTPMKRSADVVRHIDTFIGYALQRPHMYASTPDALEQVLEMMEFLRHFILTPDPDPHIADHPYFLFSRHHGLGTASFAARQDPAEPDEKRFADLAAFWRQYLAASYRLPGPAADDSGPVEETAWTPSPPSPALPPPAT
jgi:hypothetical protein